MNNFGVFEYTVESFNVDNATTIGAGLQLWYETSKGYRVQNVRTQNTIRETLGGNHACKSFIGFMRVAWNGALVKAGFKYNDGIALKVKASTPAYIVIVAHDKKTKVLDLSGCIFSRLGFTPSKKTLAAYAEMDAKKRSQYLNRAALESWQAITAASAQVLAAEPEEEKKTVAEKPQDKAEKAA